MDDLIEKVNSLMGSLIVRDINIKTEYDLNKNEKQDLKCISNINQSISHQILILIQKLYRYQNNGLQKMALDRQNQVAHELFQFLIICCTF